MPSPDASPAAPTDAQRELAQRIAAAGSVVALTGAGISVPSGIPDFRSPATGLWANVDPMEVAHIDAWRSDPERFWSFYAHRFHVLGPAQPNAAHASLVELERRGLLDAVVTQNIDRLHAKAGTQALVEVHGSIAGGVCLACGERATYDEITERIAAADDGIPRCAACERPIKPDVVLFGEMLPEAAIERAFQLAEGADLLICIGSSLEVHPVASLPAQTLRRGGDVALVTQGPTPYDDLVQLKLSGDVVAELAGTIAALHEQ